MGATMNALFQSCTGGLDWEPVYDLLGLSGPLAQFGLNSFIVFFQMAIFNVITSIYVDKARIVGQPDDDDAIEEKVIQELAEKERLKVLISKMDVDRSGYISFEELQSALQSIKVHY